MKLITRGLHRAGYDLHRQTRACAVAKDPFDDQVKLLGSSEVRSILDVGANTGQVSAKYRVLFPTAAIFCFEPFGETFEKLQSNFRDDPEVHPVCLALSDRAETRTFHVNASNFTNSLLPSVDLSLVVPVRTTEVEVTTVDLFCQQKALGKIDILKLDVQGGELCALQGAERLLQKGAISLIYSEVLFAAQYEGQGQFFQVADFLSRFGYVLFDLYDLKHKTNGQLAWCDAIFLGPSLAKGVSASPFFGATRDVSH